MKPVTHESPTAEQTALCAACNRPVNALLPGRNVRQLHAHCYEGLMKENANLMKYGFIGIAVLIVSTFLHCHQYTELVWCHKH